MAQHINGPLNWEQLGKTGRPVVFIHPNPYDLSCWTYQMSHFSTWYRCIGIDLPGYGRSPTATAELTMPDVAQACWEAVDEVTSEPAILVGLSVGSTVILHMAQQQPARTLAMIHSGCSYMPVKEFAERRIRQYTEQGAAFRREHSLAVLSRRFGQTELGQYFTNLFVDLSEKRYPSIAAAKAAGAPTINYGMFINTVIDFLIVAFVVFLLVRGVSKLLPKHEVPAATKECPRCCEAINLKATRCPKCTSELGVASQAA